MGSIPSESLWDRFWNKVAMGEGCWEWQGAIDSNGYGAFRVGQRKRNTHCIAWELIYGVIPKGLMVCHHCDNRKCVRPTHLFVGTRSDNMKDCASKGRLYCNGEEMRKKLRRVGPEGTAWCCSCKQFLALDKFGISKRHWNGVRDNCYACRRKSEYPKRNHKKVMD